MTLSATHVRRQAGPGCPTLEGALAVCLLADDLTGTCDAAVAFAARGLRTEVSLRGDARPSEGVQVWARSTGTRDLPRAAMESRLIEDLNAAPACQRYFKKVDSAWRGNSFDELALMLRQEHRPAIVAPAHPRLGRLVRGGCVHVIDLAKERRIDVLAELRSRGLPAALLPAGSSREEVADALLRSRILFCDAETPDDLEQVVHTVEGVAEPVLWVGSGGLAEALAQALHGPARPPAPRAPHPTGHVFFLVGSDHPVTLRQVQALQRAMLHAPSAHAHVVAVGRDSAASRQLREQFAKVTPDRIGCLFMTGGDTAALACSALQIDTLRLVQEFAPGIPEAVVTAGPLTGTPVLLKSGAFGQDDAFCRIAAAFATGPGRHPERFPGEAWT